jgi:hypothetical protein
VPFTTQVTITATSTQDTTKSGSTQVEFVFQGHFNCRYRLYGPNLCTNLLPPNVGPAQVQ